VFIAFLNDGNVDPAGFIVGASTTLTKAAAESNSLVELWYANVSAGTADTVTFTNGAAYSVYGAAAAYATGLSATVSSPQTEIYGANGDPQTLSSAVTVSSGQFGVVVMGTINGTLAANTPTWSNVVTSAGDVNAFLSTKGRISMAYTTTAGSWNPTVSGSGSGYSFAAGMAAAAFGP
jgi:hypothetical protein